MSRIRSIGPGILEDEKVAALSDAEFRVFVAMISVADDYGNLRASAGYLLGKIWWCRDTVVTLPGQCLDTLQRVGLIELYSVNGQQFAHLRGWEKHQSVQHPGKSWVPFPDGSFKESSRHKSLSPNEKEKEKEKIEREDSLLVIAGTATKRVNGGLPYSPDFLEFWNAYPKHRAKESAWKAWRSVDPPIEKVLLALVWQTISLDWKKQNGEFIPLPGSYIRGRRWEDEPPKTKPSQPIPEPEKLPTMTEGEKELIRNSWKASG